MTHCEIAAMVEEMGFTYAYHHFEENDEVNVPSPPYVLYLFPGSDHFAADGKAYQKITELNIELYTDHKDLEAEARVEAVLDKYGLFFKRYETYIESEKMYEVLYEMEVLISG